MTEEHKVGDLVWAKMVNYLPWPGRISKPKSPPSKVGLQWVHFFGTYESKWIENGNIKPYVEYKSTFINSSDVPLFKKAVNEIEKIIKKRGDNPDYDIDEEVEEISSKKRKLADGKQMTPNKSLSKKKRLLPLEENGASTSYTSNYITRNSREILNRPGILEAPPSPTVDINNVSDNVKNRKIEASKLSFGFLGLGNMGSCIVKNLINSGHRVNIWSRNPRKAEDIKNQSEANHPGLVQPCPTPSDVVEYSKIIFCCISDSAAVKDIVYGNCGIVHNRESLDNKGYVEMTSIDYETSVAVSNFITSKGGRYLEAQLQGSRTEAHEGNLVIIGAGNESLFNECNTCFTAIGKTAVYLGDVGFATKMNLVLQVIKGVALAGFTEALALADRSRLAIKDVLDVFDMISVSNPYLLNKGRLILGMDFVNVEQSLRYMQKDIKLALQLADSLRLPLHMTATANEIYKHTRRLGYDSHDVASVFMRTRH